MDRFLLATLFAGVVLAGCASSQPVAVVDMSRALRECREGRAAISDLRATWATNQAQLDRHQEALKRTIDEITAERARGLPVAEGEAAALKDMQDLKLEYLQLQQQLSDKERRRAAPIQARLEAVLAKLVETRRLKRVKRAGSFVPGVDREVDITPDLIQAMDATTPPNQR